MIWALVFMSGAGMSPSGLDDYRYLGGIASAQPLQFAYRKQLRVTGYGALGPSEWNVHNCAFPGHPHGQGADFVQADVGVVSNAALGRAPGHAVLHPVSREYVDAPVIHSHGEIDYELSLGVVSESAGCSRANPGSQPRSRTAPAPLQGRFLLPALRSCPAAAAVVTPSSFPVALVPCQNRREYTGKLGRTLCQRALRRQLVP